MPNEDPHQRILRIVGGILIAAGLAGGVAGILYGVLRELARDCWWIAIATCLLLALRAQPLRRIAQAIGVLMLLIWLNFSIGDLAYLGWWITDRIHGDCIGFMLMILGGLIIATNDPQGRLTARFRQLLSMAGARRGTSIAVCVVGLWLVNPHNSHSLCLGASEICERIGANQPAITFARLARDTFPPESFCLNCYNEIRDNLSWRIARLHAGQGSPPPETDAAGAGTTGTAVPSVGRPDGE